MTNIIGMSSGQRIGEAMKRSLPELLPEARREVEAMLTPASLTVITAGLVVWAGSHLFGAGEIMDVILLGFGVVAIGAGAVDGFSELAKFTVTAINAKSDPELTQAGKHLARAIDVLGITAVSAVLLRQSASKVIARGTPKFRGMVKVGPPPPAGIQPKVSFFSEPRLDGNGQLVNGSCSIYGEIKIWLGNTLEQQYHHLMHEVGHRMFAPTFGPLREFRASLSMSGYLRSAWLMYLEEAIVEARAALITKGAGDALLAVNFPIKNGYVMISQLAEEGIAVSNIIIGSMRYVVFVKRTEELFTAIQENVCVSE
jgi:hypothetical protein